MSEGCVSNVSSRMSNVLLGWPVRCVPELVSNALAWWWVSKLSNASARRGTGIRGRTGASMSDAIIPALKHRIPSELRS